MKKSLITLLALVIILTTAITGYAAAPNRATYLPSAGSVAIVRDIDLGTGTVKTDARVHRAYAEEMHAKVNEQRKQYGLKPLEWNESLYNAAILRGVESHHCWSHMRPNGTSWDTVATNVHGENLAFGDLTPASAVNGLMNSPGHRANILRGSFTSVAYACVETEQGPFWVQLFSTQIISTEEKAVEFGAVREDLDAIVSESTTKGNFVATAA